MLKQINPNKNPLQNVKKGNINDVNNFINNVSKYNFYKNIFIYLQKDEYYTQIYYQKTNVKGHEAIKGAFYAINRNKMPEPPKNIDQSFYYMNNHKPEYFIKNNQNTNYNNNYYYNNKNNDCYYQNNKYNNIYGNNTNFDLIKKILLILLCFLIAFLVYDFYSIYKNVKKDNGIERERCIKEYNENKCDKMTSDDGPIVNDFCTDKLKCINDHTVYFHIVLIKYIRSVISNCLRGNSLINVSLFSITLLIIFKILY